MSATKKKTPKGKPGKTSIKTIRAQVNAEFLAHAGGTLNPAADGELIAIFDATIGKFAKRTKKKKDVWRDDDFRKFILVAAKWIGKEVAKTAGNGSIGKEVLRKAAVKVMRKMEPKCPAPVATPKFEFKASAKEGQVCQDFLAANAGL